MSGDALIIVVLAGIALWGFSKAKPSKSAAPSAGRYIAVKGHAHGPASTSTRRLIAKHEAGHAVAARALGGKVVSAEVYDDGEGGMVWARLPSNSAEDAVAFLLAGQIAAGTSRGSSADNAAIRAELRTVKGSERSQVRRDATRSARRIVSKNSGQIRRDAATLDKHGRL